MVRNPPRIEKLPVVDRLIDAAESLFGEHGIDGVSLRQISNAAGTGNNYAVQYHFDDLLGLIRAITRQRMPEIEAHRARLLMQAKEAGKLGDTRALLEVIYRPLIEHTNQHGERAYARFILAALNSPVARNIASTDLHEVMPIAVHVTELLANLLALNSPALLAERQRLVSLLLLNSIFSRFTLEEGVFSEKELIENALDMAAAALQAPASIPAQES